MMTSRTTFALYLSLILLSSQAMSRTNIVADSVKCMAREEVFYTVDSLRYRISYDGPQPTATVTDAGYGSWVPVLGDSTFIVPRSVTIGGRDYLVRKIGRQAFAGHPEIKHLVISEGTEIVNDDAFAYCMNLESISLPATLEILAPTSFRGCSAVESINIAEGNGTYDSREGCNAIISTQEDCLVAGCGNSVIPEGVRSIGEKAFSSSAICSIRIPASVTQIVRTAFLHCRLCSSIEVAPDNPVYDSRGGCNAIIETATGTLVKGCGMTVFPVGVGKIGDYAFCGATMPDNLIIPEGIRSIGDNAFSDCGILTLRLPSSLQRLGNSAFSGCGRLGVVEMSGTELHLGWSAFEHCRSLYAVRLPQHIKHEGYNVFRHTPYQAVYEREYGKP